MAQYSWDTAPAEIRRQVGRLSDGIAERAGSNLVGVYLHGSLAMGCFNPARSDIDLLVVTVSASSPEEKATLTHLFLDRSNRPRPLEISVLAASDLRPWRYPTPYQLHYSEGWRGRFEAWNDAGAPAPWLAQSAPDPDLAAHITIARNRGVALLGPAADGVFTEVPRRDYLASILLDIADAVATVERDPVYVVLNLCRVYRYLCDDSITSKDEAGAWAIATLSSSLRAVVRRALTAYRGENGDGDWGKITLVRFALSMTEAIAARLPA